MLPLPSRRLLGGALATLFLATAVVAQGPCPGLPAVVENFDGATTGTPGTYPGGWVDGGGNIQWWVNSGGTSSSSTGPSGDHTSGSGNYIFLESSSPVSQGDTAIIEAPAIDVSGIPSPTVDFWYSMYGATTGDLYLEVWDGAAWAVAWSMSGNQGLGWLQATVPVTAVGTTLRVRFRGVDGSGFTGDMAIDDVTICGSPLALFQANSPQATLTIDGSGTNSIVGPVASASLCTGFSANVGLAVANAGVSFDVAITAGNAVPRALVTPAGQVVNVDILGQPLLWLNGVNNILPVTFPGTSWNLPLAVNSAFTATAQMIVFDATAAEGFVLSGAGTLEVSNPAPSIAGPSGDDTALEVVVGAAPLCGPASVPFYGTSYSSIFVSSNGRVTFTGPDADFGPSTAEVLTDNPFVGCWADLSPQVTPGGLVITATPTSVSVDFANVPQWAGTPFGSSTFSIQFDTVSGAVGLANMATDPAGTANMLVGITNGNLGATDPGQVAFTPGATGLTGNATDAIYQFGTIPTFSALSSILFFPNGFANYDWIAF